VPSPPSPSPPTLEETRARLEAAGQAHLLAFYDTLDETGKTNLLVRIAAIDLERVPRWIEDYVKNKPSFAPAGKLAPAPYYPADHASPRRPWDRGRFRAAGEALLRTGKVAAFTVAGGQGTRLGFDGPKGCYGGGAVTGKPLFQCLAEWILAARERYGADIPWCVMTSPLNHDATLAFFREHDWLGLGEKNVIIFNQGVMPSFDRETGRILLTAPDEPATNPDGHGGSLRALYESGALDELERRGVEHISYTQIDNPLVRVIDPDFLGLHAEAEDSSGEMSSKMLAKTEPGEKVGVFCLQDGKLGMIEYSDLPAELAEQRDEGGALRFNAGNPAIHAMSTGFVRRLSEAPGGFALPFHRADKKIPYVDLETGERVEPEGANGVKLETFVFDALPFAERSLVLETERVDEFAPIKNATGADSAATSAALQTERAARWLEARGVTVPRDETGSPECVLEISPLCATRPEELDPERLPEAIRPGEERAFVRNPDLGA